jgi:hypothetical protein
MSRGQLDRPTLATINDKLPDMSNLRFIQSLSPDFISIKFDPDSTVPIAAVALQDAQIVLSEARIALHEAYACQIWYREKEPNETAASFFVRFYVDDAAMRLYSAQEHLAYAIIAMLKISEQALEPHGRRLTSQASIVGHFLRREKPDHRVTQAASQLWSAEWQKTMAYRGRLVHDQPPLVEGLGTVWKRYKRWQKAERPGKTEYLLGIGGGDEPEFSVDDLIDFAQPSLFHFAQALLEVGQFYVDLLNQHGITMDRNSGNLTLSLG